MLNSTNMARPLDVERYRRERGISWAPLTAEELEARRLVQVNAETVANTSSTDFPGHYGPLQDDSWNLSQFTQNLKVEFHHNKPYDAAFSLIGVDASIANAFRRILLAEIPTLAIEDVYVFNNTSVIQDEVLCHRLGLIPLTGGKDGLQKMSWFKKPPPKDAFTMQSTSDDPEEDYPLSARTPNEHNTIVLTLDITCRWKTLDQDNVDGKKLAEEGITDPAKRYVHHNVYASDLKLKLEGKQDKFFSAENAIRPVNPDILIAKLRPGQTISLKCFCYKGIGSDHAKFSPVATASYRLLPSITITQPILGADAKKFARCFPRGVIGYERDEESGEQRAVVRDPMKDTVSRECLRHEEFKDKVKLGRVRDHFIFSVESTGQFESDELYLDAVRLLRGKAERFKRCLDELEEGR